MKDDLADELLVRRMVERWALWRDAGDWERFATVWHPDGVMRPFSDMERAVIPGSARDRYGCLRVCCGLAVELLGRPKFCELYPGGL